MTIEFLKMHDLRAGSIYTYLPEDFDARDLYRFHSWTDLNHHITWDILAKMLRRYLSESSENVVILEDSLASKTDSWLKKPYSTNVAFYGDEVYHYLLHERGNESDIANGLAEGSHAWRNVGCFTSLPPEIRLQPSQDMDDNIIHLLAEKVKMLFVDAYDLDGYLIWEKAS